jgi:hypothetical protein
VLYVGHFSFDQHASGGAGTPWHGLFTCVAEGASIDAVIPKFNRLIRGLAKQHAVFEHVDEIYMDACIELPAVPAAGVLSYITVRAGEDIGGISSSLLGNKARGPMSYACGAGGDGADEPQRMKPFLRLRRKQQKTQPASPDPGPHVRLLPKTGKERVH